MKKFLFQKQFLSTTYKNPAIYLFILGIFFTIFTIFSNTGCFVYPASFTCMSQFSWSIPVDSVDQMKLWYELWSKGGANPNFRVENPEIYVLGFNWISRWINEYFFTRYYNYVCILNKDLEIYFRYFLIFFIIPFFLELNQALSTK